MGFFDAQATARSKRELLSNNSINKLRVVSPETQVGIVRKISDGDTLLLNSDIANTRIAGIDTYETPHDGDWLLNPYNQKRMEKQRMQLSAEVGRPVTNNDVFAKGIEDKQNLLNTLSPAATGDLPILAGVQQTLNQSPTDKSPRNNYGRNLGTVTPLVGNYTTLSGKEVTPNTDTIGMMKSARDGSRSGDGFFKGIDPTRREEYKGAVDGYDVDPINIAKQVSGGIVSTASSVSKSPKKLYELLGGDYLEDGSIYSKSVKTIINTMDKGGKYLDKFKEDVIAPDDRRVEALKKQVGKAFDEGNYVTGVLGSAIDNPAGAIELAASMYGFSKAMGAKGLTGAPVIAAAFTDNADQARIIFEKEHKRKPNAEETAVIVALSAIGTAVDTVAAKFMFSSAGGDKAATALTATVDSLVAKVPNMVARVALGTGAKVATMMGTEGIQEGLTEATTVLGGTQDLGKAISDKYLKQIYEASALGAISGPGMHVINTGEAVLPALKEVPGAINTLTDKIRTREPKLSVAEQREVELAGGTVTPTSSTEYKKVLNDTYKEFNTAIQAKDKTAAETHIDTITNAFLAKVEAGELKETDPEYIDTYKKLVDMDIAYNKSKLGVELKEEAQAIARTYPRMDASKAETPDILGAKFKLQKAIDMGVILDDVSDGDLMNTAKNLGLSEASIQQYIKERGAITTAVEAVKAISKSMSQVEYEATIGEKGFVRYYERMKSAQAKGAKDEYNLAAQKLNSFKATQQTKIDAITGWIEDLETNGLTASNKQVKWKGGVFKVLDGNVAKSINGAKKVLNAANMTVEAIDTIMKGKKIIQEKKPTAKAEVKTKPTTKKTEIPIEATKTKEVVKDTTEVKEEATVAEKIADEVPVKQKVKAKVSKDVYEDERIAMETNAIRKVVQKLQIKAQSIFKDARQQDTYIEALGTIKGKVLELNDDTINALTVGYLKWIAQDADRLMNVTTADMARMLGKDTVESAEITVLSGKGVLRKNVVQALGQIAAEMLEINVDKDMPFNVRQNIITSIGNILLARMLKDGTLIKDSVPAASWNGISEKKTTKSVEMIKFNESSTDVIAQVRALLKEVPELGIEYIAKEPNYDKPKRKKKHEFRKRPNAEISQKDEERLSAQEKIQHNPKKDVYSAFNKLGEWKKVAAGWTDTRTIKNKVHSTKLASIKAVNNAVERSIATLEEHMEKADRGYYFNYFMSGNGRDMIDSNTFNPQSDKLHRHMDYTGEPYNPMANARHEYLFQLAVLQGLKYDVDKMTKAEIAEAWSDLQEDTELKKMARLLVMDKGLTTTQQKMIAEYAADRKNVHTLDAMVALGEYIKAERTGNPMLTTLQLEVDAVTSGWILALMQNPAFDMETNIEYLAKGGIYLNNPDAVYQDRVKEGFLDSYETVRDAINEKLGNVLPSVLKMMKVDRKFAKAPFMTNVTYGAGMAGVKADIVNQFIDKLYDMVVNNTAEAQKVIRDITGKIVQIKDPVNYLLDASTRESIKEYIDGTYGKAVESALKTKYKAFTAVRDNINKAFQDMFKGYTEAYDKAYKELEAKGPITKAQLDSMEKELSKLIPTIKSPNGTDVQIFSKEKMSALNEDLLKVQTAFMEEIIDGQKSLTTTAEMRRIAASKAAGGVVPIHFIDGAVIGEILKKFQMTGIYDAGMFNINDVDRGTETYNKELIRISKEYNLLDEILKAGEKYGISDDVKAELQEAKKVADKNRAEIFSSDLNVQHFAMDGIAWKSEEVKKISSLEELKKADKMKHDAIMSVIEKFKDCK